ncbi:hypothetical protein [Aeromicrobium sp. UC242_57]|uniref:hypothetical protein n=1 Tax=Aeromicrobium sp. UC242_57 TaxID=3374624 RepID=UPI003796A2F4
MTTQPVGPMTLEERALGPDLARGLMLLFIALANSHYFLMGDQVRGGFPMGGSAIDDATIWFIATFVDGRAFPMFGLLFGYGVAQIVRRQQGLGRRGVRHLLWRRSAALVLVGFVHGCSCTSATSSAPTVCCCSSACGRCGGAIVGCWASPQRSSS